MKQNILEITVPEIPESETPQAQAGAMYEHNATALCFLLPESLCLPEYRYYAEFVTVSGTARTEYLEADANRRILLPLPLEITSQMTALCVLQAVKINAAGKTEQKITAKTVRLYFSPLQNTDKMLDADHAFSVNTLLEAIRQNTFKGDKGDKGDAYILTQSDKSEIAAKVDEAFYGLPLQKHMTVRGQQTLSGATDGAAVSNLCVRPTAPTMEGIYSIQVAVGKNMLSDVLNSALYSAFSPVEGNYTAIPLCLKPETEYILAKLTAGLTEYSHSYLKFDTRTVWFCHKSNLNLNTKYSVFTVPASGQCAIYTTYIYLSQNAYQQVLDTDWNGLAVMEKNNSVLLQKTFSEPLYAVSTEIGDIYDFVSGTLLRRTAKAQLSDAQLNSAATIQIGASVYRYKLTLPSEAVRRVQGCSDGCCAALPTLPADITDGAAWEAYKAKSGADGGIWFGAYDDGIYVISERNPTDFTAWLEETPLEILYAAAERAESGTGTAVVLPCGEKQICVSPNTLCADIRFNADISAVVNDFESRLQQLENNI